MKRLLHIIALVFSLVLIFSSLNTFQDLPGDSGALVEKKYSDWSGVLRAWVSSQWHCDGSFLSWLNRCASAFESDHPGVYIEFTAVDAQALQHLETTGIRPPELLFFSPGLIQDASPLAQAAPHPNAAFSDQSALPVCMGGYIWVINTKLCSSIPTTPVHLADESGRRFSSAAVTLQSAPMEIQIPVPGLDLGLPANAASSSVCTLDDFIKGNVPALIISQQELARLIRLQEAGRGPEWRCIPSGSCIYADQLLLGSVIAHNDEDAALRTPVAHAFLQFLLTDDCQQRLAEIGAFPTTSCNAYPPSSPYAILEGMLHSLNLSVPPFFQQHSSYSLHNKSTAMFGN